MLYSKADFRECIALRWRSLQVMYCPTKSVESGFFFFCRREDFRECTVLK